MTTNAAAPLPHLVHFGWRPRPFKPGYIRNGELIIKRNTKRDVEFDGDIIIQGATVGGNVTSRHGSVKVGTKGYYHTRVEGTVSAAKDVTVSPTSHAKIIEAGQDVVLKSERRGEFRDGTRYSSARNIKAGRNVTVESESYASKIDANGSVKLNVDARSGDITAQEDITLQGSSSAGNLDAGGNVSLEQEYGAQGCASAKNITAQGNVSIFQGYVGNITTPGNVSLRGKSAGDITAGGNVEMIHSPSAKNVTAGGYIAVAGGYYDSLSAEGKIGAYTAAGMPPKDFPPPPPDDFEWRFRG